MGESATASGNRPGEPKSQAGTKAKTSIRIAEPRDRGGELTEIVQPGERGEDGAVVDLHIEMDEQVALPRRVAEPLREILGEDTRLRSMRASTRSASTKAPFLEPAADAPAVERRHP